MKVFAVIFTLVMVALFVLSELDGDTITIPVDTYNMMLEDIAELNELKCEGTE